LKINRDIRTCETCSYRDTHLGLDPPCNSCAFDSASLYPNWTPAGTLRVEEEYKIPRLPQFRCIDCGKLAPQTWETLPGECLCEESRLPSRVTLCPKGAMMVVKEERREIVENKQR